MLAASSSVAWRAKLRAAVVVLATTLGVLATSCSDGYYEDRRRCDFTVRRCASVCDYWCDGYGCWPTCWDRCWDDCYRNPVSEAPPASSSGSSGSPVPDAGAPGARVDGGGGGVLCTACVANDECERGALCIFSGGSASAADAGASAKAGFCGHSCQASTDCPQGFTCTQLGGGKQCLPNAGACR